MFASLTCLCSSTPADSRLRWAEYSESPVCRSLLPLICRNNIGYSRILTFAAEMTVTGALIFFQTGIIELSSKTSAYFVKVKHFGISRPFSLGKNIWWKTGLAEHSTSLWPCNSPIQISKSSDLWLELQTKVHTMVHNHGEGPYSSFVIVISSFEALVLTMNSWLVLPQLQSWSVAEMVRSDMSGLL